MSGEGKPQIVSSPQDDLSEAAEDARPDVSSETDTFETKTTDAPPADSGTDPAPDPEPAAKPRRWRRRMWKSGVWLVALLALFVLGGDVIRGFVFAMIWGVIVGTYSSVFVASTALLKLGVKRDWSKPDNNSGNQFANIDA